MKKNKLLTTVCVLATTFLSSNLQAKTSKSKKVSNDKTKSTHKVTNQKAKIVSKKTHNTGIYSIPANNRSPLLEEKMSELRQRHTKALASGSTAEKRKAVLERKLLTSYSKWKGTRYALGGDSKSGIDCSALTRRVYREALNKELPRVSTQQIKKGTKVAAKNLKSGDIVYFTPEGRTNHTAVYVGNSLFINASSSKGVVMSSLKSPYWRKYFRYGVRVHNA